MRSTLEFSWIDWLPILALLAFLVIAVVRVQRYNRSVADFLSANRCARRYLLGVADGMTALAAISVVATFEKTYAAGFAPVFWATMTIPIGLAITLSGFITYRFRETRAFTMAQFFEMRYSRKFRIFAAILAWVSGVINFGIFPAVSARFFISFCHIPAHWELLGLTIPSFPVMTVALTAIALYFTLSGGQISILVTDFWQGFFSIFAFTAVLVFLCFQFSWADISRAMIAASEPGNSLVDPFDIGKAAEFSIWFYLILYFQRIYSHQAWQGSQAYDASAINAHEQKVSRVVGSLRGLFYQAGILLIPICAIALLKLPEYAPQAALVQQSLGENYPGADATSQQLRTQMTVPTALAAILPVGLLGTFAAVMVAFFISTHNSYMHSWGSIFIQDVVMPIRGKPFQPGRHIWMLRASIIGVAVFSIFFSIFFPIQEYIVMFFMLTGAIYLGGAGAVIIGGMYWKRGTTKGAWAAMIVGSGLAISAVLLRFAWPYSEFLLQFGPKFPATGAVTSFWCGFAAICSYVIVSLLDRKPDVDFDKLFHRGAYAVKAEQEKKKVAGKPMSWAWKIMGVTSQEFSFWDKLLFGFAFWKGILLILSFVVMVVLHAVGWMTPERWMVYWMIFLAYLGAIGLLSGYWVSIGGLFDLGEMKRRLGALKRDDADDGWVVGHTSLADLDGETKRSLIHDDKPGGGSR